MHLCFVHRLRAFVLFEHMHACMCLHVLCVSLYCVLLLNVRLCYAHTCFVCVRLCNAP